MQAIKAQVRQYISDNFMLGAQTRPLADADSLLEHHVLDSTGFLELIAFLEETFRISVADEEMVPENLDSLDHMASFLSRKLAA